MHQVIPLEEWHKIPSGMLLLINKEKMCVCYKHSVLKVLTDLSHIEFPHLSSAIISAEEPAFYTYSDMELKLLYLNTCGQKYEMYGREGLIKNLVELFKTLPESDLNGFQISLQAGLIDPLDLKNYAHNPDGNVPKVVGLDHTPKPLISSAPFNPVLYPSTAPSAPPASYTPVPSVPKPRTHTPANPDAPRSTTQVAPEAPKASSKTGRVWEIAEQIWAASGNSQDWKELRKQIVTACESEGINGSTASVQYGKWKLSKQ